mmetsp:Transcript_32280/g.51505  ORF Transcript_32280/g.51505 Transcript_32280/m.51505 type:complete len:434 (-) Transcript_32280:904-2205(-)
MTAGVQRSVFRRVRSRAYQLCKCKREERKWLRNKFRNWADGAPSADEHSIRTRVGETLMGWCRYKIDLSRGLMIVKESCLNFDSNRELTTFPDFILVEGDLILQHSSITHLPDGLTVEGDLDLSWSKVQSTPRGLVVGGSLLMRGCRKLKRVNEFKAGLDVRLTSCKNLVELPETGLSVVGDLCLRGCTSLKRLPNGINVGLNMSMEGCAAAVALCQGWLHIGGNLDLTGCVELHNLGDGLIVGGDLEMRGCRSLKRLPETIIVGYSADFSNSGIEVLCDNLKEVAGNLYLSQCTSLTELMNGLKVENSLNLSGCTALTALPQQLKAGDLDISGCSGLRELPGDLEIRDILVMEHCSGIREIPRQFLENGFSPSNLYNGIYIGGSGVVAECVELIQQEFSHIRLTCIPAFRFHETEAFTSLDEAIEFWTKKSI